MYAVSIMYAEHKEYWFAKGNIFVIFPRDVTAEFKFKFKSSVPTRSQERFFCTVKVMIFVMMPGIILQNIFKGRFSHSINMVSFFEILINLT